MSEVLVGDLLEAERLGLELVAGEAGLKRALGSDKIAKAGLHLTGFFEHFRGERLQIFGKAETAYLNSLPPDEAHLRLRAFFDHKPVGLVFTYGVPVPAPVPPLAEEYGVAVMRTPLDTTGFSALATSWLEEMLSPKTTVHGVLMDVFGVGILLVGESGIGKSEIALDLILRGHRFVADDVVEVVRRPRSNLVGSGSELIRHHIEIRGLGILNVKDLFGVAAIRERKKIELVVELIPWEKSHNVERVGLDERSHEILGVSIPHLQVPVSPGRNLASIIEIAARNQLLRLQGIHSAKEFQERLLEDLTSRAIRKAASREEEGEIE